MTRARAITVVVVTTAAALLLPAAGQPRPVEDDGSSYTWPGAIILTVDVRPWGGGYVRSTPYLIDCPLACIRPFDEGRDVTLTAYPTPGHTFQSWNGACAGQPNPCTLRTSGAALDVTAVFSGFFVPPTPPRTPGPALSVSVPNPCAGCTATLVGTGFAPGSTISLSGTFTAPPAGSFTEPSFATTDASGTWTFGGPLCDFGAGPYVGPYELDITATDAAGGSASGHISTTCA